MMIPLYSALHHIPVTIIGMDHMTFQLFISALSPGIDFEPGPHLQASIFASTRDKLVRLANSHVSTLDDVPKFHLKSRRVWVRITDPSSPHRTLDAEALAALSV